MHERKQEMKKVKKEDREDRLEVRKKTRKMRKKDEVMYINLFLFHYKVQHVHCIGISTISDILLLLVYR